MSYLYKTFKEHRTVRKKQVRIQIVGFIIENNSSTFAKYTMDLILGNDKKFISEFKKKHNRKLIMN